MKENSLNHVIALAEQNGFEFIAIQYVVVVPSGSEIKVTSPITWHRKLGIYALSISNYYLKGV